MRDLDFCCRWISSQCIW